MEYPRLLLMTNESEIIYTQIFNTTQVDKQFAKQLIKKKEWMYKDTLKCW